MDGVSAARAQMLGDLVAVSHVLTLDQVPEVLAAHAARAGWPQVLIYLADLQQDRLYLLSDPEQRIGADAEHDVSIEGTVPGRAFQLGQISPASASSTGEWWVPLLNGTERLGVLRVTGPGTEVELSRLAGLLALLLVSKRGTSDSYARLIRRRRMKVASEMEWRLMPQRTFATDRVLISAVMEPAYEISGDAYDYGLAGDTLHVSVFDAMGHDTAAGLTANLALATARNERRQGAGLAQVAERIDETLAEQFQGDRYATGILAELDSATGELTWTNRGHPPPVVIRGGRTALTLDCRPTPPMGLSLGRDAELCRDQLEPGDRLLLYTDGITEARNPEGQEFGVDRLVDFVVRHHADDLPVPETLRRLIRHHLQHHHERLNDDATLLLVEWHGPTPYPAPDLHSLVGLPPSGDPDEPGSFLRS